VGDGPDFARFRAAGSGLLRIALIVGAGFSAEARLPSTNRLARRFLAPPEPTNGVVDKAITEALTTFWQKVFGSAEDLAQPTLEDHFTVLDLAANTGHQRQLKEYGCTLSKLGEGGIVHVWYYWETDHFLQHVAEQ
jgi:hypothetical protein